MITVTITRKQLTTAEACPEGMALFEALRIAQGLKHSVKVRDWTITHQLWLSAAYPSFYGWGRDRGLWPQLPMCGADLYGANLRGANLYGANLRGANLYGANLRGAKLYAADLYGADLRGADLYGATLSGADLSGADLYGATLSGADLYGANLTDAIGYTGTLPAKSSP